MKLAIVTATFPPYRGGTGNVAYHHARLMQERGYDVTVFSAAKSGMRSHVEFPFAVRYLPTRFRIGNAPWTPSLMRELKGFDLIHLHCPYIFGAELTLKASKRYRIPLIVTYHNDLLAYGVRGILFQAYTRMSQPRVLQAAQLVMATSADYGEHSFLKNIPGLRVEAVPNGVDVDFFCPGEGKRPDSVPTGAPLALFVGALDRAHHFKGLPVLLKALEGLPEWHLAVVGEGDLKPSYQASISSKDVESRVHWMGAVDDNGLRDLYRSVTVTVLPSITLGEAFGLVLVESMACGTPVIASDLPGVRSVVPAKQGLGWLAKPSDSDDLMTKMTAVLKWREANDWDPWLVRKFAERFSWTRVADELQHWYSSLNDYSIV